MAMQPTGPESPSWKGGRSIASNGYILVKVGKSHHLSDVRGYAYEHRVVAEKKIGRRLRRGEVVHHIDHKKTNNHPSNLKVYKSIAHHFVEHRREGSALRLPGQKNRLVQCACRCGQRFRKFDESGRPRKYVSGHNPSHSPTMDGILKVLALGRLHRLEVVSRLGGSLHAAIVGLSKMKKRGLVESIGGGFWRLGNAPRVPRTQEFPRA